MLNGGRANQVTRSQILRLVQMRSDGQRPLYATVSSAREDTGSIHPLELC